MSLLPLFSIDKGGVENNRRRCVAFVEGGRIDEGLEGRTGQAFSLNSSIKLALTEIIASDHGLDLAGAGIKGDQGTLSLRLLSEGQTKLTILLGSNHLDQQDRTNRQLDLFLFAVDLHRLVFGHNLKLAGPRGFLAGNEAGERADSHH